MIRKASIAIIAMLLFTCLFSAVASADCAFQAVVDKANADIQLEINKAVAEANSALNDMNQKIDATTLLWKQGKISANEANGRILNYEADFQNLLTAIAQRLVSRTDGIAVGVVQEAQRRGIKVICTYETVNLAGKIVLVDPLRIVGN